MYHEQSVDDELFSIICTFHVPLFFFVSGIVLSLPPGIEKLLRKCRRLLVPMLVVGFANALLIGRVRDFFITGGHNGYWYLLTLALFYIFLLPFNLTKERKGIAPFFVDAVMAVGIWFLLFFSMRLPYTIADAFNPGGAFAFWPYFIIGFICRKYSLTRFITGRAWLAIVLTVAYVVLVVLSFNQIDSLPLMVELTIGLTAIAALMAVFHHFNDRSAFFHHQLILIGRSTLDIYIYHYFFIRFINLDFLKAQSLPVELITTATLTIAIVYASMGIGIIVNKILSSMRSTFFHVRALAIVVAFTPISTLADNYDANNYPPENTTVSIDQTNLPIVFINTCVNHVQPTIIHKDYRVAVRMKIIDNEDGINYGDTVAHPYQRVDYEGWVAIKYRGNSSFDLSAKKPYGFKTLQTNDVNGKKQKVSIMGMPKDNDWALLAPYNDRSMIRDVLMFQLARPYFDFTPKARHCEVIVDGIYYGVYIMTERVRKGNNRLPLDDPGTTGDELTGGYQVQVDRDDEEHYYTSKHYAVDKNGRRYSAYYRIYFQYVHPEYDEMMPSHPEQLTYLQGQIDAMENAIASAQFTNPQTGYARYIDPLSFIDYQLSQEVSNNVDGYRLSTNLYKQRDSQDGRFKTALWDFNIAFGNADYCGGYLTNFWVYQNTYITAYNAYNKVPFWWMRLMKDPEYVRMLKARWAQYRQQTYSDAHITATIDSLVELLNAKGARQRNYTAHPLWNREVWPVPNWRTVNTYEKEIAYLRSWIAERIAWMDDQLDFDVNSSIMMPDAEMDKEIAGYYTLQGIPISSPPRQGIFVIRYKDGTSRKVRMMP